MAITIYEDLVNGTAYEEDDKTGTFERPYRVCGLPSNSGITAASLYASDGTKIIPIAGQMHPTMPDFRVRSVRVTPVQGSRTDVKLWVRYVKTRRRLLGGRLSNISVNTQTDFDKNGEVLIVGYKRPAIDSNGKIGASTAADAQPPLPPAQGNGWDYDYATVPFKMCEVSLEIDYFEKGSPFQQMAPYVQTLNSKTWQGRGPRRWFCDGFSAYLDSPTPTNNAVDGDGVVTGDDPIFDFIVTRRFLLIPVPPAGPGWDPILIFVDRSVGLKPTDINPIGGGWLTGKTQGNGWRVVQLYEESDFNDLKLASIVNPPAA